MVGRCLAPLALILLLAPSTVSSGGLPGADETADAVTVYVGDVPVQYRGWFEGRALDASLLFGSIVTLVYETASGEGPGGGSPICDWLTVTFVDDDPPVRLDTDPLCIVEEVEDYIRT